MRRRAASGRDGFYRATAINDRGQVVGYAFLPDGTSHAVMWEKRKQ
jgi:probable HAF family extracellular repeat protein